MLRPGPNRVAVGVRAALVVAAIVAIAAAGVLVARGGDEESQTLELTQEGLPDVERVALARRLAALTATPGGG